MPKHILRNLTLGSRFWTTWPWQSALQTLTSEWWSWPFLEVKKQSQYFRACFQSCFWNPQQTQEVCVGQGGSCGHLTSPLALHLQMRTKGKSGWIILVPAYPHPGCWTEGALGSQYKKWHIAKLARLKRHQDSQIMLGKAERELWWPGGLGHISVFSLYPCQLGQMHS